MKIFCLIKISIIFALNLIYLNANAQYFKPSIEGSFLYNIEKSLDKPFR